MPPERTPKILHQTTLFGVTTSAPPDLSAQKPKSTCSSDPGAELVDEKQVERNQPRRIHSLNVKSSAKGKKLKAVNEDRVITDVLLCIKPEFTELIIARKKNYEYRNYKLKESVTRLWLYETAPTSAITYVMSTTQPKIPGEVNDPSGIGNDDFDAGLTSKYAYPVIGLYKLRRPITTAQLKERFDIFTPQGWRYATKKLVDDVPLDSMEKLF